MPRHRLLVPRRLAPFVAATPAVDGGLWVWEDGAQHEWEDGSDAAWDPNVSPNSPVQGTDGAIQLEEGGDLQGEDQNPILEEES